jgi:hypothetical protein
VAGFLDGPTAAPSQEFLIRRFLPAVDVLIAAGADLSIKDNDGVAPLLRIDGSSCSALANAFREYAASGHDLERLDGLMALQSQHLNVRAKGGNPVSRRGRTVEQVRQYRDEWRVNVVIDAVASFAEVKISALAETVRRKLAKVSWSEDRLVDTAAAKSPADAAVWESHLAAMRDDIYWDAVDAGPGDGKAIPVLVNTEGKDSKAELKEAKSDAKAGEKPTEVKADKKSACVLM